MLSKSLFVLALPLFFTASLLPGCAGSPKSTPTPMTDDAEAITCSSATLVVYGMSCPLCANNVDKQLLAVPGVQSVNVDMGSGEVKVTLAPKHRVTRTQLAKAVDDSGFSLQEVRIP